MQLHPIFKFREDTSPELLSLLNSVTLGTNGAHYRHLDTTERILEADKPLHLTMERNDKVIGNVTFCRRNEHWYIRYFAFDVGMQSSGKSKSNSGKSSLLKKELQNFFDGMLKGDEELGKVDSFYAYIDPQNEKSLWMCENFGFQKIGNIATQSYSRIKAKEMPRVERIDDWELVKPLVESKYSSYEYFFLNQTNKPPFYIIRDDQGGVIASAKVSESTWEIKRLPGKFGGILTKLIPFIPGLNRLIKPKKHTFIVPEAVVIKNDDPQLFDELFQGILYKEKKNLILWWIDEEETLYKKVKKEVKWGLLHKLIGASKANVMQKSALDPNQKSTGNRPIYTSGYDFI